MIGILVRIGQNLWMRFVRRILRNTSVVSGEVITADCYKHAIHA